MYSFGRRHPYNPFWGGFVIESPRTGTFKRFSETKVLVLSVSVTEEQHAELKEMLDVMWKRRRKYSYNYIGFCLLYTSFLGRPRAGPERRIPCALQ